MNFFATPVFCFLPFKYYKAVKEKGWKIVLAILLCIILLWTIRGVKDQINMIRFVNEVKRECPDFALKNGTLELEKSIVFDEEGLYMAFDDSIDHVNRGDVDAIVAAGHDSVLIVGRHGGGLHDDGETQVFNYSEFGNLEIDKDMLCDKYLPLLNLAAAALDIFRLICSIIVYCIVAAILQFVTGLISDLAYKTKLDMGEQFKITFMAKFPPYFILFILGTIFSNLKFVALISLILQLAYIALVLFFYSKAAEDEQRMMLENNGQGPWMQG